MFEDEFGDGDDKKKDGEVKAKKQRPIRGARTVIETDGTVKHYPAEYGKPAGTASTKTGGGSEGGGSGGGSGGGGGDKSGGGKVGEPPIKESLQAPEESSTGVPMDVILLAIGEGMKNAMYNDMLGGITGRNSISDYSTDPNIQLAYGVGQLIGDLAATGMAAGEFTAGQGMVGWGLTEAALTSPTIVAAIPGLLTAAAGGIVMIHSTSVISFAAVGTAQTVLQMTKIKNGGTGGKQKMNPKQNGKTPMNNKAQNEQTNSLSKKYKLSKDQQRRLHDRISGKGYGYKEIEQIIKNNEF